MQIKQLFLDDDAVSPVIGVILMVAITVILAAVVAAFVLGLGDSDEVGPSVSFSYDYTSESDPDGDDGQLRVTVRSGDSFTADRVTFEGDYGGDNSPPDDNAWHDFAGDDVEASSTIRAGARATIDGTDSSVSLADDFDIDIVWTSSDGSSSNIIGSRSGPDA